MPRPKSRGELKPLNLNIDANISDKLNQINADTGLPKTAIVEKALSEYFDKYEKSLNELSNKKNK